MAGEADPSSSSSSPLSMNSDILASLKRIKHALIGNTSRKIELASRPEAVARIASLLNEKIDDTTATLDAQNARHQVFLQAADVVATLAIPRRKCVSLLIQLDVHRILLDSIKTLVSSIQAEANTPEHHSASSSALHQRLLHAVRALKSLYVAVVNLVDPFRAQAAMSELVLSSAHARAQAMGLAIPSAHRSPSKLKTSSIASGVLSTTQLRNAGGNPSLSQFADQIFLAGEATTILQLLRLLCRELSPSTESDGSPANSNTAAQHTLIHLCDLLATCVRTSAQRQAFDSARISLTNADDGVSGPETWDAFVLLSVALETAPSQLAEAIVRAVTTLLKDPSPSKGVRLPTHGVDQTLFARMSERMTDPSRSMRLAAAEWHVAVYKSFKAVYVDWDFGVAPVIAVLLNLLLDASPATSARAGIVLAFLVTGNRNFQETASNMEAFQRIRTLFDRLSQPVVPYETAQAAAERANQEQAALLAVSALCTDIEDLRRKVLETKLLPYIVKSLTSPFSNVRCAAAQCARSLSRSINLIKTALLDTNAASSFVESLSPNEDRLTQLAILAVACNVFIEFSPLKTAMLETPGLVERIVELTKIVNKPRTRDTVGNSKIPSLPSSHAIEADREHEEQNMDMDKMMEVKALIRHHALTAIKNMTYWSSSALKQKTCACLTWEYAVTLLRDPDITVRTEMLNVLRNIACNEGTDIDLVVRGIGEARLFSLIEDALHTTRQDMLLHGLYLVSNIATGTEAHRSAIMNRLGIVRALLAQLSHSSSDVRVAAVWATINLCHRPEPGHRRYNDHAQRLRALGFEARLKEMRDDPSIDVRERVRDALEGGFDPDPASHGMIMD